MTSQKKLLGTALENQLVKKATNRGLRAKKQPLSGALKDQPNDVVIESNLDRVLAECKVRAVKIDAKGTRIISLDLDWLSKVTRNAAAFGFDAGVVVFRPKGSPKLYGVLNLDVLLALLQAKSTDVRRVS
jgi:Holliday junction resolvase